jgi:hypothetical protein
MNYLRRVLKQSWKSVQRLFRTERRRRADHYLFERYGMAEKPAGWNQAVLGWFFGGPERRQPSEDFSSAFHRRAQVPPPRSLKPGGQMRDAQRR